MERLQVNVNAFEAAEMVKEFNDLFEIYLDSDIAGDNDDRRNKLSAIKNFNTAFKPKP